VDVVQAEATSEAVITGKAIPEVVAAVVEAEEEVPTEVVEEATVEVDMVAVDTVAVGTEALGTAAVEVTLEIQLGKSVRVRGKQLVISSV
jgi:hypothetical protein